jgi:hypothetical protein
LIDRCPLFRAFVILFSMVFAQVSGSDPLIELSLLLVVYVGFSFQQLRKILSLRSGLPGIRPSGANTAPVASPVSAPLATPASSTFAPLPKSESPSYVVNGKMHPLLFALHQQVDDAKVSLAAHEQVLSSLKAKLASLEADPNANSENSRHLKSEISNAESARKQMQSALIHELSKFTDAHAKVCQEQSKTSQENEKALQEQSKTSQENEKALQEQSKTVELRSWRTYLLKRLGAMAALGSFLFGATFVAVFLRFRVLCFRDIAGHLQYFSGFALLFGNR